MYRFLDAEIPFRGQHHDMQTNLGRSNSADSLVSTTKIQRLSSGGEKLKTLSSKLVDCLV